MSLVGYIERPYHNSWTTVNDLLIVSSAFVAVRNENVQPIPVLSLVRESSAFLVSNFIITSVLCCLENEGFMLH